MHWYFVAGLIFELIDLILRREFMIQASDLMVESFKDYKPLRRLLGYIMIFFVACLVKAINIVIWPANCFASMVLAVKYQKEHPAF